MYAPFGDVRETSKSVFSVPILERFLCVITSLLPFVSYPVILVLRTCCSGIVALPLTMISCPVLEAFLTVYEFAVVVPLFISSESLLRASELDTVAKESPNARRAAIQTNTRQCVDSFPPIVHNLTETGAGGGGGVCAEVSFLLPR